MATTKKTNQPEYGSGWKVKYLDLDLPSGNLCQVRRPGVQGLIKAGVLESVDVLTGVVQQVTIPRAEGTPLVDQKKVLENPETLTRMIDMLDDILLHCVKQPKVLDKYEIDPETLRRLFFGKDGAVVPQSDPNGKPRILHEDLRDPEAIYVDEVDLEDKMFIMNFVVGGSNDLAKFRNATEEALGGVHDLPSAQQTSE